MKKLLIEIGILAAVLAVIFIWTRPDRPATDNIPDRGAAGEGAREAPLADSERVDFSGMNPVFRFSARLPEGLQAEYVSQTESVNIYDPQISGENNLEKSRIFVRFFEANDFLTLTTVNILDRREHTIDGHSAVSYEIEKKPGVPDFAGQPSWRSGRHEVTDIRMAETNPGLFYVFAVNPEFQRDEFESFLESIVFHNDPAAFAAPMDRPGERVNKKSFGTFVTPENSPVQPERFTGFHNAADLEIFPGEEDQRIAVRAICGGPLARSQNAQGYGGVLVQECLLENEPVTVIYGHVVLPEIEIGQYIRPGQELAVLGAGFSAGTGGERKHLHLGIHRGKSIDIRGYVRDESELSSWIDPVFLWD